MPRRPMETAAFAGDWPTTAYSLLGLKEYNAAHEPTHIYWQFCRDYIFGF